MTVSAALPWISRSRARSMRTAASSVRKLVPSPFSARCRLRGEVPRRRAARVRSATPACWLRRERSSPSRSVAARLTGATGGGGGLGGNRVEIGSLVLGNITALHISQCRQRLFQRVIPERQAVIPERHDPRLGSGASRARASTPNGLTQCGIGSAVVSPPPRGDRRRGG